MSRRLQADASRAGVQRNHDPWTARGEVAAPYRRLLDGDRAGAARLWADLGCPYEAALALLGSADEASLRQALWTFIDLGASATVRLTRHKMRQLAIRSIPAGPRTSTRKHPLGLTRREREVLELICARYTNAEIARSCSSRSRPSTITCRRCWPSWRRRPVARPPPGPPSSG